MLHYPSPIPYRLEGLPSGVDAVRKTLKAMVNYAKQGQRDVGIITLARQIIAARVPHSGTSKDYGAQLQALQNWTRDQIRYVRDPVGAEMVQTPTRTVEIRAGDCDDKATLLAALLMSVGFPCRFVAIGVRGGDFSHVLVEAKLGTRWIPCETIVKGVGPGWYPPDATARMEAHI